MSDDKLKRDLNLLKLKSKVALTEVLDNPRFKDLPKEAQMDAILGALGEIFK